MRHYLPVNCSDIILSANLDNILCNTMHTVLSLTTAKLYPKLEMRLLKSSKKKKPIWAVILK